MTASAEAARCLLRAGIVSFGLFASTVVLAKQSVGPRPLVGLGVGAYTDSGEKQESLTLGGPPQTTREDFKNNGLFSLGAWVLVPLAEKVRFGGGARWFGTYGTKNPDADADEEPFRYGTMFQWYAQGEYSLDIGKSDLLLGAQAGLLTIIPGSDFKQEIDSDAQAGWSNTALPRLGGFIGPLVGIEYPTMQHLALRGDLGLQFSRTWLLDSPGADDSSFNKRQQLRFTRLVLTLGAELDL